MTDSELIGTLMARVESIEDLVLGMLEEQAKPEAKINSTMLSIHSFVKQKNDSGEKVTKAGLVKVSGMNAPLWASERVVKRDTNTCLDCGILSYSSKHGLIARSVREVF